MKQILNDKVDYIISLIACVATIALTLIYWLAPSSASGNRLYQLFIECIPTAVVALIAIPIVNWLFHRKEMQEQRSPVQDSRMQFIPEEISKASSDAARPNGAHDLLIVVNVQQDFISGALKADSADKIIPFINNAIHLAESKGMAIVFTKDWHPRNHWSFQENNGPWPAHCVVNTPGAELNPALYRPLSSVVFEFGVQPGTLGYSPLENVVLDLLVTNPNVHTVYVVGVALEYCVQATCCDALKRGKRVIALEGAIAAASNQPDEIEKVWRDLAEKGAIREPRLSAIGE